MRENKMNEVDIDNYANEVKEWFSKLPLDKFITTYKPNNTVYVKLFDTREDAMNENVYDNIVDMSNYEELTNLIELYLGSQNMYNYTLIKQNKFEKYQTVDNDFNCIVTSPEGKVIMKIADYLGRSTTRVIGKLIQDGDKVIYSKRVKQEHLMRKFDNGVGVNLNFIELLNDNDIIAIQIGKKTYAITKFDAILNGIKPKSGISGWERQTFIPLKYWKSE